MAAKRLHDGSDKPEKKRLRALPSFSTVIREAVTAKQKQNLLELLEPLFRRVVREVVEGVIVNALNTTHLIPRSPQMQQIEKAAEVSYLQLVFGRPLSLPIFTGTRIGDSESNPLQIFLIDTRTGGTSLATLPAPLRVEVVVLNGDFAPQGQDNWTSNDFNHAIVRERTGRRPLITGDIHLTLREGVASADSLVITDNSSWIKSKHFKIGVRIVPGSFQGPRIKEAITEAFRVKDQRGELCMKHYPPVLTDEVWRLDKISKDGTYHKRLSEENINTVQDFLKLAAVDAAQLRRILGAGMTDRVWGLVTAHARTCLSDEKLYTYCKQNYSIVLNSICEIIGIQIDGMTYAPQGLSRYQKAYIQEMVQEAYSHWSVLEEDGILWDTTLLRSIY